jgi:hypothetical protein
VGSRLEAGHGVVQLPLLGQGDSQAEEGRGVAGLDLQGLAEMLQSFAALAVLGQGGGQAVMGLGAGGRDGQGLAEGGDGLGEFALGLAGLPQEVPGIGVAGVGLEDLVVEPFGLGQVTRLLKPAGQLEGFKNRGHCAISTCGKRGEFSKGMQAGMPLPPAISGSSYPRAGVLQGGKSRRASISLHGSEKKRSSICGCRR